MGPQQTIYIKVGLRKVKTFDFLSVHFQKIRGRL